MKLINIVTCTAALILATSVVRADDNPSWWNSHMQASPDSMKYTANELDLNVFGSYINPERKFENLFSTNIRQGAWGGGGGLSYFFLRNVGLGADVNVSDHPGNIIDQFTGNLILRLPLGSSGFSPYIFGGGGRAVTPTWDWVYGGGVGVEYRFTPVIGIFGDGRFLWSEESTQNDRLLLRVGLRVIF